MATNTSFAGFPRLSALLAAAGFLPRQLTYRGSRLVYSRGIIALALIASALIVVFDASVSGLIPLYAIGVFTSFTLSQAGMAAHHLREKEPGWRAGLVINGVGAVLTLIVDVVIAITKFTHGAWVIVVLVPVPDNQPRGTSASIRMKWVGHGIESTGSTTLRVNVNLWGLQMVPTDAVEQAAKDGQVLTFRFKVQNVATLGDVYTMTRSGGSAAWLTDGQPMFHQDQEHTIPASGLEPERKEWRCDAPVATSGPASPTGQPLAASTTSWYRRSNQLSSVEKLASPTTAPAAIQPKRPAMRSAAIPAGSSAD